jgi:PAS domain S-box-containing protein
MTQSNPTDPNATSSTATSTPTSTAGVAGTMTAPPAPSDPTDYQAMLDHFLACDKAYKSAADQVKQAQSDAAAANQKVTDATNAANAAHDALLQSAQAMANAVQQEAQGSTAGRLAVPLTDARSLATALDLLASCGVLMLDHELRIVLVRGRMWQSLGLARSDLEGRHVYEVVSPENRASVMPLYNAAMRGQEGERRVERAGRTVRVLAAPIRWGDGSIVGVHVTLHDVTDVLSPMAAE